VTAREEILAAPPAIGARTGRDMFTLEDVIGELARRGSRYKESTIRLHVASRMCSDAPDNHARTFNDLRRARSV
jgi:hypothetical protein